MGANDAPEPLRSSGITGIVVGMVGLHGLAECRPEAVSVIFR
jgi:hypothetical protein